MVYLRKCIYYYSTIVDLSSLLIGKDCKVAAEALL